MASGGFIDSTTCHLQKNCSSLLTAFAADQKLGQNCVKETEKSCAINSEQP